jgi:anti-sigma regulatory factor (Ser/Thr protein kinase)
MPLPAHFPIEDPSQVGNARRGAMGLATSLGFDSGQVGKVGIAATEAASNILKHAERGALLVHALHRNGADGLEIIALDKGPGILDVAASLRDGHSTRGTMGGGLGALSRLSDSLEIFTQPGKGTAVRLELWAAGAPRATGAIEYGGICVEKRGETVCGDGWAVETWRDEATVLVADGLGHGISAHEASRAATETLRAHARDAPAAIMEACHGALARTRGAAVAIAQVASSGQRGTFAGVGNVVCRVEGTSASGNRHLVSHNGTVGHTMRKVQEFSFPWPTGALLILHSDGLGTHWDLAAYPGLVMRHPALISAVLYRDYDRGRDDVSVVVLRNRGGGSAAP